MNPPDKPGKKLLSLEAMFYKLKQDLEYYKSENRRLLEEKKRALEALSRLSVLKDNREALEDELDFQKKENERATKKTEILSKKNREIMHRCSVLSSVPSEERKKNEESHEVIVCLEDQIQQLEAIIILLKEHEEMRRSELGG